MGGVVIYLAWIGGILAAVALAFVGALDVSAPNPVLHASVTQACNGPTEIGAVISADPTALNALKGALQSQATEVGASGNVPVTARVANNEYVVTVGSGANAKTCLVPMATTHL